MFSGVPALLVAPNAPARARSQGRWVDSRIAGIAQLVLVQVLFPNTSLAGHVCGMAAGAVYLVTGMHALGAGLGAGLDTYGAEAAQGIGWLVVLGAAGYWYLFVHSHTPRFANSGTVGGTTGAARAAADIPPAAPEVAGDDDYGYDDAIYTDQPIAGGVDTAGAAAAAAAAAATTATTAPAAAAAADPMESPAVVRSARMARFEKKPPVNPAPDQFADRFGPQFHGSPRAVGTSAASDGTDKPTRPAREIRAERFAGAVNNTAGFPKVKCKGKGKGRGRPSTRARATDLQAPAERWPPRFTGGGTVGGSATTFTGTDHERQVQMDKLGGIQDLNGAAAGPAGLPNKPAAVVLSSAKSRRGQRPVSITEVRLGRLERFDKPAVLRLSKDPRRGIQCPRWDAEPIRTADVTETDPFMMGEHCGICRNLDLLPVFCLWCGAPFCASHAESDAHECAHRDRQLKNESLLRRLLMVRKLAR